MTIFSEARERDAGLRDAPRVPELRRGAAADLHDAVVEAPVPDLELRNRVPGHGPRSTGRGTCTFCSKSTCIYSERQRALLMTTYKGSAVLM